MELQIQEEKMEEDNWKEGQNSGEQRAERSRESTYHTDPDLLLTDTVQVFVFSQYWSLFHSVEEVLNSVMKWRWILSGKFQQTGKQGPITRCFVYVCFFFFFKKSDIDQEQARKEMELQLEAWHKLSPGSQEEVSLRPQFFSRLFKNMEVMPVVPAPACVFQESAASSMWQQYQHLTSALSQQLCEQLRLILEPTLAAKLKSGPIYSRPCDFSSNHWLEYWNSFFFHGFPEGTTAQGNGWTWERWYPTLQVSSGKIRSGWGGPNPVSETIKSVWLSMTLPAWWTITLNRLENPAVHHGLADISPTFSSRWQSWSL